MLKYKNEISEEEREEIIKEFLPYIKYTAFRLSWNLPHHVTIDDLISVGLMGLMDALSRFEPGKVKLKTYAELRIKGSMIDELRATAWIPRSMRKKMMSVSRMLSKIIEEIGINILLRPLVMRMSPGKLPIQLTLLGNKRTTVPPRINKMPIKINKS